MLSQPIILSDRAFLFDANIVLVAHQLNVSIFNPPWLMRNGILDEKDFAAGAVVTPPAVVIPTPGYHLTFIPDRIQVGFTDDLSSAAEACNVIEKIARQLPHTPFIALGINFGVTFGIHGSEEFSRWNTQAFMAPRLAKIPQADRSLYGAYFSFNELAFRARIDLKPAPVAQFEFLQKTPFAANTEIMVATFNFHRDLQGESAATTAIESLHQWSHLCDRAKELSVKLAAE